MVYLDGKTRVENLKSKLKKKKGTRKILKRKKRTDTQYDNKARSDGQRFGKLKTWNLRGIVEEKGGITSRTTEKEN